MTTNMTDNDMKIINHTITRLLAMREHSAHELRNKLLAKGLNASLIDLQLVEFAKKNIQSDERFVESYIRSKANKGQGPNRIRLALKEHHISSQLIEKGLQEAEMDFFLLARQVYVKKYPDSDCKDWKQKQKQMRFLQYRGFEPEQIAEALKKPLCEP